MDVQQIAMDPDVARVHYKRYRESVRAGREKRAAELERRGKEAGKDLGQVRIAKTQLELEDEELKKAYRALSLGKRLIDVPEAIGAAGLNTHQHLPHLAIAKANWVWCYLHLENGWSRGADRHQLIYTNEQTMWRSKVTNHLVVPSSAWQADNAWNELRNLSWRAEKHYPRVDANRAAVPIVPPHLRPDELSKYYILWEAVWDEAPPVDPILLSRVNNRMYAVVAQWDLTEVEQGVLNGRFG